MSDYEIVLPYHDADEPLDAINAALAAADYGMEPDEVTQASATASELADRLPEGTTVGEAVAALEATAPEVLREIFDCARASAGLPSIAQAEESARLEFATSHRMFSGPARDSNGEIEARCSEPSCTTFLAHPQLPGGAAKVAQRRWWCDVHANLAAPGDDEPWDGPRYVLSPSGTGYVSEDELRREQFQAAAEAERIRSLRESRLAESRADAEAIKDFTEVHREAAAKENRHQFPWGAPA